MTLTGALPVYMYVAKHSPHGQGSIGMLEKLVSGWGGKALVLMLLGFAATDYVITMTLSAADAAEHVVSNPVLFPNQGPANGVANHNRWQMYLTLGMLVALGAMFLRGFREVIGLAVVIVGTYLVLNAIVIGLSLNYLVNHQEVLEAWWAHVLSLIHI